MTFSTCLMDTSKYSSDGSKFQIWVPSNELFGDVGLVFVKVTRDSFFQVEGDSSVLAELQLSCRRLCSIWTLTDWSRETPKRILQLTLKDRVTKNMAGHRLLMNCYWWILAQVRCRHTRACKCIFKPMSSMADGHKCRTYFNIYSPLPQKMTSPYICKWKNLESDENPPKTNKLHLCTLFLLFTCAFHMHSTSKLFIFAFIFALYLFSSALL